MQKFILLLSFLSLMASCACISGLAEPTSKFQRASGIVAVLTNFGTEDYYVGALEGSIYSADPTVRISTISHQVKPFDITEGSYILAKAARWYPTGTVFVGDVDPGSTRDRRFIVMTTLDSKLFVGPDNGLFTEVIHDLGLAHAYQITNQSLMNRENESATFQGLSVDGPVAAHLAGGVRPEEVGPEIRDLVQLPVTQPEMNESEIIGSVVHVDHYGNLITNIPGRLVTNAGFVPGLPLSIKLSNQSVNATFATTYGDVAAGQWLALISSDGAVEVARNLENAAKTIGASAGVKVTLLRESNKHSKDGKDGL